MKMGQSVAMLLFTGVSTIGVASGAGYRIAVLCAAVLRGRAVRHRRHRLRVLQRAEGVESS